MQKKYDYIVKIIVDATCDSPIRVGNNENDMETVLKDVNGEPFIPGTSIAGVLRAYVEERCCDNVKELFGGQKSEGSLSISDGNFKASKTVIRPRVRINKETGTVEKGNKFDVAHIEKDARFTFTITWMGRKGKDKELGVIYEALSSINSGNIVFGALKTNGFGKVLVEAREQKYDMTNETQRNNWLQGIEDTKPHKLHNIAEQRYVILEVRGKAENILVKGEMEHKANVADCCVNLKEKECAIIPGSTMKGVIRERVLEISNALRIDVDQEIFGGESKAGTVFFHDVILEDVIPRKVTRIHINKFTGGVIKGDLFTEEPLASKVVFTIKVPQNNIACKLILFALRDMAMGFCAVGSGKSSGRGLIDIEEIVVKTPDQKEAKVLIDSSKQITIEDTHEIIKNWME